MQTVTEDNLKASEALTVTGKKRLLKEMNID